MGINNPNTPISGRDFTIVNGDRVFIFSDNKMYEYRWNVTISGNELLDLFKEWEGDDITEDTKDILRQNIKEING